MKSSTLNVSEFAHVSQTSQFTYVNDGRLALTLFLTFKRVFDIVGSLVLLPFMILFALGLYLFNPLFNCGPVWFTQQRMGRNCAAFTAVKFRTMTDVSQIERQADGRLEVDRITPLGAILRATRMDELPQVINVLRGEMSLIGPRPDYYAHACLFLKEVPGYRARHAVRPGISGLAQTEIGYVEGVEATKAKVNADLYYIHNRSIRLELRILLRTLAVIFRRAGI